MSPLNLVTIKLVDKQSPAMKSFDMKANRPAPSCQAFAFTLIELMVAIAIIAVLAALLLPSLGRGKSKAQGVQCLNNLKHLQLAWLMYIDDHEQKLPPNSDQPQCGRDAANQSWIAGWLRNDGDPGSKYDSTNTDLLIGTNYYPFGSIGGYTKEARIYHCPGDKSRVTIDGVSYERVRSVSMNCYMNGNGIWQSSNFVTFRQHAEVLAPSEKWVFIDEREDSINDGYFAVDMTKSYSLLDIPAAYHTGASCLSFADGHVETRLWLEPTTKPPRRNGGPFDGFPRFTSATDRDLAWFTQRTTFRKENGDFTK
jgi:prepilin-type N-terminal cleavage/methylation domain-containing protein